MKYQTLLLSAILVGLPVTHRIHASPVAEASAQATYHDTVNSDADATHVPGVAAEASACNLGDGRLGLRRSFRLVGDSRCG